MKKKGTILLLVVVCAFSAYGQTARSTRPAANGVARDASSANSTVLPIRRVILYSNGVAYIERRGIVNGNAEVNLSFKQSQIDDVLKSMVVLDLGQGRIGAVSYNSSMPASARTAEIPFSVQSSTSDGGGFAGVIAQLQGAKVVVSGPRGEVRGSILTVERKQLRGDTDIVWTSILVLVSENGEISSFDLNTIRSIRVLDDDTRKDLNEFASATASARRRDAKTITVTSVGTGSREMAVSYTIAAPIWKTTYRVVLDQDGMPFFQGWAIVDNVSEEDWENVQLSLVSGSPVSFIQNLQQPFYRYRPIVPTPRDLKLRPQLHESNISLSSSISGTVSDYNGAVVVNANVTIKNNATGQQVSTRSDNTGNFMASDLGPGSYTVIIDAPGFKRTQIVDAVLGSNLTAQLEVGGVSEVVTVTAESSVINTSSASVSSQWARGSNFASNTSIVSDAETSVSDALMSGNTGVSTAAVGSEIGDLFEYKIETPVTVMRDRSALIPIVQTKMEGERVAVYNKQIREDRPLSGVLLKNGTNLTLESGSMTVLDGNAYAGEAMMERLKPKEQRIISFALDLGTGVRVRENTGREPTKLIKIVDGTFQAHYFRSEKRSYLMTNQTERPKVVYIEHPIRDGWQVMDETPRPAYTTHRYYRFRLELGPFEERELEVAERQPLMDSYRLASISRADLELFVSRNYIDSTLRARLERLVDLRARMFQIERTLDALEEEVGDIETDQKRLRANIESLSKTAEAKQLIARYIAKANEQESRLEQIESERKRLQAENERLERELATEIKNFEVS
jgi:hypothetical protein